MSKILPSSVVKCVSPQELPIHHHCQNLSSLECTQALPVLAYAGCSLCHAVDVLTRGHSLTDHSQYSCVSNTGSWLISKLSVDYSLQ